MNVPLDSVNARAHHPDLNHIEQGFKGDAALEHPDEVVDRKPDLLTGLNQPLDRTVHVFIMCLAESVETLLHWWLSLPLLPRVRHWCFDHCSTPIRLRA